MSIEAMKQWRAALEVAYDQTCSVGRPKDWKQIKDALDSVNAAISQAQGGKAGEAVAWFEYSEQRGEWFLAYTKNPRAKTRPLVYGDTHPAPGVPDGVVRDAERFRRLDLTEAAIAAVDAMLTSAQAQKVQP